MKCSHKRLFHLTNSHLIALSGSELRQYFVTDFMNQRTAMHKIRRSVPSRNPNGDPVVLVLERSRCTYAHIRLRLHDTIRRAGLPEAIRDDRCTISPSRGQRSATRRMDVKSSGNSVQNSIWIHVPKGWLVRLWSNDPCRTPMLNSRAWSASELHRSGVQPLSAALRTPRLRRRYAGPRRLRSRRADGVPVRPRGPSSPRTRPPPRPRAPPRAAHRRPRDRCATRA